MTHVFLAMIRTRQRRLVFLITSLALHSFLLATSGAATFPVADWSKAESPEQLGWSSSRLAEARRYAETIDTEAVMIVEDGQVVDSWGDISLPYRCHSIRKSLLSALYGILVAEGRIDLSDTLAELDIDDNEPVLTEAEQQATVLELLKARSGVYHAALYETEKMRARRPARGSHPPGSFWYYNNWDFNALGTIFERAAGRSVFEEFEERIATPLGMQDFDRERHTRYVRGDDSNHPAYPFRLSTRDLARFGLLFLREGRWIDEQIVPEGWVARSTKSFSAAGESGGYGLMWWVAAGGRHLPGTTIPDGSFTARGAGGHYCLVIPDYDLVIVHRVNTFNQDRSVTRGEFGTLVEHILAARPGAPRRSDPPFDLLITGGQVMDGTGNPWFAADVGIREGRIAAVGDLDDAEARRVVDARGKVVAPGFIDLHSHAAPGLASPDEKRRAAPNLVTQGITTVAINPDGGGPIDIAEQRTELEDMSFGPNVALMVGHNSIRRAVLGSNYRREANDEEIARMRELVRLAMEAGALGLTAGLEYRPGIWSTTEELVALVEEIVPFGGAFIVHERSSGADPMWYLPSRHEPGQPTMLDNIVELIDVSERTGVTVVATHIKARGANYWGSSRAMIELIRRARARGVKIYADQYPYNTTGSDGHIVLIPRWVYEIEQTATAGNGKSDSQTTDYVAALSAALADTAREADLRRDVTHEITRRGGAEKIIVMDHPNTEAVGKSLRELADSQRVSEVEIVFRLQQEGYKDRPGGARLRSFSLSELDVEALAREPWTATSTDAGVALPDDERPVHPRFFGSFPRKIRHYAIEREIMTVEDVIRSATSLPAQILRLRDRGQVREGFHADLVIFDLKRVRDRATFFAPNQYSEGVELVLIGGEPVVEDEKPLGHLPGVIVARGGSR